MAEIKKRRGKDLTLNWSILTNGNTTSLSGRDLTLVREEPNDRLIKMSWTNEGNKLIFHFRGRHQVMSGTYKFTLWENFGKNGQTVVDCVDSLVLVDSTDMEEGTTDGNLTVDSVDLTSANMIVGAKGADGINANVEACNTATANAVTATANANTATANANAVISELEGIIERAEDAISDAENATSSINTILNEIPTTVANANTATTNANTATTNANTATTNANTATANANKAIADAEDVIEEAEGVVADARTAIANANTATANANNAANNANSVISGAQQAKANAETATANANTSAQNAELAAQDAVEAALNARAATANAISAGNNIYQGIDTALQALNTANEAIATANQVAATATTNTQLSAQRAEVAATEAYKAIDEIEEAIENYDAKHTVANSDHAQAVSDHAQAVSDHNTAVSDHEYLNNLNTSFEGKQDKLTTEQLANLNADHSQFAKKSELPLKVSELTNDSGYVTDSPSDGKQYARKDGEWAEVEGGVSSWNDLTDKPTTLEGYGITDAKIANGVITLGDNSMTPLPFINDYTRDANTFATNGYIKTISRVADYTANLPSECIVANKDRWGVLFFLAENDTNGTGTQMFYPIDGTYKGRIFTRSVKDVHNPNNAKPEYSTWNLISQSSDIPTKVSQLINDIGYLTAHQDISGKQDKLSETQMANINADHSKYAKTSELPFVLANSATLRRVQYFVSNGSSFAVNLKKNDIIELSGIGGSVTDAEGTLTINITSEPTYYVLKADLSSTLTITAPSGTTVSFKAYRSVDLSQCEKVSELSQEVSQLDLKCGDLSELETSDKTTLVKAVNEANSKASEKYSKPSGGIPSTDLASAVQTSLGKADSALQEHQTLKTINNESIVGEGNISIQGGGDSGFMLHGTTTITEEVNSIDIDIPDSTEIYVYLHFIGTSSNTKNGGFRLMLNHNSLTQYRLIDSSDGVRMLATQQRNSTFFAKAIDKNTIFALWSKNAATTISECYDGTYSSMNVGSYISIGEKIKKIYVYAKDSQVFGVGSSITIYRK